MTSGASDTIFKNFFSRNSRATGPNTRVPTGSPASLIKTAAFWSKRIYVPSRRRCSLRVRTITAFTTLPFCTCPSGAASFTEAVIMSPRPAFSPVEPPSGRIICSLRAPELSATSSMLLIITAMASISLGRSPAAATYPCLYPDLCSGSSPGLCRRAPARSQAPASSCALCLSASSASTSRAVASPPTAPRRPRALHSSRRAHKTSCCAPPPAGRTDAPSSASPAPRSSWPSGWRPLLPPLPCAGPAHARSAGLRTSWLRLPPLAFLRCGGARTLAQNCLDPRNVLAHPPNLLQALGLPHVQLKLQLEQLVREILPLVLELGVG